MCIRDSVRTDLRVGSSITSRMRHWGHATPEQGTVRAMANPPRGSGSGTPEEGTPEYDWLYGTQRAGLGSSGQQQGEAPRDPEPTQVLPTRSRYGESRRALPPVRPPARGADGPPPGRPRRTKRRRPFRWVIFVLLLWLVFLVAVPVWAWTKITKVDAEPDGNRPDSQPGHTYLLAVSYTHLRAHETDSYLVCRLL